MRAVILAGGKGTRLLPYTTVLPKPLMPIGDMPILEVVIRQIKRYGFTEITLAVGHLAELLEAFFGDGRKFGVKIDYCLEDEPLGTAGPLSMIEDLTETFLVMNGDVLTTLDYSELLRFHQLHKGIATIGTFKRSVKIDFGVIEKGDAQEVKGYVEKPVLDYLVSMGVYIFESRVLKYIKHKQRLDFPDLVKMLIVNKEKVVAYPFDGYWLDIGRHDDYGRANEEFEKRRKEFKID